MSSISNPLDLYHSFGDLLKYLRIRAGLTQMELAEAVGYSESQISRLESNARSPDLDVVSALFFSALGIAGDEITKERLLAMAKQSRCGHNYLQPLESDSPSNNLPIPLTSFIGREKEIAEVVQLLVAGRTRLLTLTGAGGTGKTRLALEACRRLLDNYSDGVRVVWLAPLHDPPKVPETVATALGIQVRGDLPVLDLLTAHLRNRRMLLVLDNCEHLTLACARLIEHLLQAGPCLEVLATSREALGVDGEMLYRVPSLTTPGADNPLTPEAIGGYESVRLFADRSAHVMPGFQLTASNARSVAEICLRLDGIPLAIELAAARTVAMSVETIASHLDDRFHLLSGGSRTALPRHQTLRGSIDWSYNLLDGNERLLLQRLAVFAGGWTLDAAEAVCGQDRIDKGYVPVMLASLVSKSLVVFNPDEARYRLLEIIRQYSQEKLLEAGGFESLRSLHLAFFMRQAEQSETESRSMRYRVWANRLDIERDNLRAALEWGLTSGNSIAPDLLAANAQAGLRLIAAVAWVYYTFNPDEGVAWLERYLALSGQPGLLPPALLAKGLLSLAVLMRMKPNLGSAGVSTMRRYAEKALDLFTQAGDDEGRVFTLGCTAFLASITGDHAAGLRFINEGEALARQVGLFDKYQGDILWNRGLASAPNNPEEAKRYFFEAVQVFEMSGNPVWHLPMAVLGEILSIEGDLERAGSYLHKSLAISRELNSWGNVDMCLLFCGEHAYRAGDFQEMEACFQEILGKSAWSVDRGGHLWTLHALGIAAQRQGKTAQAFQLFSECLDRALALSLTNRAISVIGSLAGLAVDRPSRENFDQALITARLLGFVDAGPPRPHSFRSKDILAREFQRDMLQVRALLGDQVFDLAFREGRTLPFEDAVALARQIAAGSKA